MDRREFIKIGAAAAIGAGIASAIEIPILEGVISSKNNNIKNLQNQATSDSQAFLALNRNEQPELEAMVETIIPTDSNGPGAKEAGVIFFIDHQLASEYGHNGRMYMQGPFVMPGQAGSITVNGVTYSDGVPAQPFPGPAYQYNLLMREFWRNALLAVETYSNSAYGNNIENLSSSQITQVLTDLYNNKPSTSSFNNIVPVDFFNELIFMTYSGFLMDPIYGGNANMVGWTLTGFTGANRGDSFKEGRNVLALMVASKPTRYPPHSLAEYEQAYGEI
jgi:gluconate 2-dehydrogenase gamma chain